MKNVAVLIASLMLAASVFAGFPSTESYLPAVGRVTGQGGAEFYTTIWVTNLTGAPETFTFAFLKGNQANANPASFSDTLSPGQTKTYENVVGDRLGLSDALGAARITASGEVLVAERIYDQAPGDDLGNTQGLFFAGVPKSFSISLGQSASIQGVDQGGSEDFRYNFALVETGGGSPTVNVQLFDGDGTLLGQKAYAMQPYEQLQPNVKDLDSSVSTTNARITATVTGGTGSVLLAGAQVANASQDSSGFEMSFRDDLLGSGGTAGVTSLNGLTGAVSLIQGSNVTLTTVGNGIKIDASGGPGGGGVTSLNGLTGALSMTPGYGISIIPSGSSIQVALNGGGPGGLTSVTHDGTLVGAGTGSSPLGVSVPFILSTSEGSAIGGSTTADAFTAVFGEATTGDGVGGTSDSGSGVYAKSTSGYAVQAIGGSNSAIVATNDSQWATITATNSGAGEGIHGAATSGNHAGVVGESAGGDGVHGGTGAAGTSGVSGRTTGSGFGVFGEADDTNGGAAIGGNAPNGGKAAHFYSGDVYIDNNLHVTKQIFAGTKDFEIDDPLDPENKYLVHASIESSEMLNVYTGNATLDGHGVATIVLPDWMEAENGDFRYQLTAIGSSQPGLYVAREVGDHRFVVAGGASGGRISWQISGVRRDPWAAAHPLIVEKPKAERDRGFYLHPEAYGAPPEKQMNWADEPNRTSQSQRSADGAEGASR